MIEPAANISADLRDIKKLGGIIDNFELVEGSGSH